ncbi:endonuclease domain-containing 1 protein-like [Pygocentrus nattereri]|uniref:Uncharacterized protein n=1 Tax=Pygocentrus nattereri TaxID=42514 RepID=A0A3B4BV60_PYGNA|nr:endonuclease domain-containing 1 protein-like [Pygocentrus nattereri]
MMKCLLHPLILLLAFCSLAFCRLVDNFINNNGCPDFFLSTSNGRVTPTILQNQNRYRQICQRYMGRDRFATLYDTQNRIPVYSAYLHVPPARLSRMNEWWTEPDLSHAQQADNRDYLGRMHRGHLYPASHNNDIEGMDATFTLTNAAPQDQSFNSRWFQHVEEPVNKLILVNCKGNRAYIVTGVVPSKKQINNRVKEASHFWTAYCCLDNNGRLVGHGAYLMYRNGTMMLNQNQNVRDLENQLTSLYRGPFQVFGGHCY